MTAANVRPGPARVPATGGAAPSADGLPPGGALTLAQRLALFIGAIVLLALGGALVIHALSARQVLRDQHDMRNRDAAASLALALSQHKGDAAAMQAVAAAQFDQGHYQHITLTAPDGRRPIALQQPPLPVQAPDWFMRWLPLDVAPGTALVTSGWVELGTLSVAAHTAWAYQALWSASLRTAGLLATLAGLAMGLTVLMLRAWQRPLAATVAQAQALEQGRFVEAPLPELPELRHLTRSMNATVRRLRDMFAAQAQQVAFLQRQAQLDPVTSLPLRQQLVHHLAHRLSQHDGQCPALLLVRVAGLATLDAQGGRAAGDAVLRQVAQALAEVLDNEPDTVGGRLSGADFAVCLPLPGMAMELAPTLQRRLQALHPAPPWPLRLVVAWIDGQAREAAPDGDTAAEQVLAAAQLALQRAEGARAADGLAAAPNAPAALAEPATAALAGLPAWQARVAAALAEGRVRLGEFPVQDAQAGLIHLECPLRLQLDRDGDYQPAARWLALARRAGLLPQVDAAAIRLALRASAADQRPRGISIAASSLSAPGFVAEVAALLAAEPAAAARLSIEWVLPGRLGGRSPLLAAHDAAVQAIEAWRGHGVTLGIEHAGAAPDQLTQLRDLGLHYVKVDARHLRGVAADPAMGAYARSLVGLIQLLGLKAYAEGVSQADDLAALWQLGFDGATGQALRASPSPAAAAQAGAPAARSAPQALSHGDA